ncbi:MAG TPA: hypothetical protein VF469_25475 [Kofleriaceae bacterium]
MTSDATQLGAWSTPAKVGPAATTAVEDDVTLSSDALEMIFAVEVTNATTNTTTKDFYYTSRSSIGAAWAKPEPVPFDTGSSEETPRFSGDDKTLYFASDRATAGNLDIYSVKRQAAGNTTWGTPVLVAGVNTSATEKWFTPCTGGHYVVVRSVANAGTDLFEGTLGGGAPTTIANLNSTASDTGAFLTQDCLTIYFASFRTTPVKIFTSHRATLTDAWPPPTPVDDFKIGTGGDNQEDPWLSPDGKTFAFASDAAGNGNKDIYLSTR